MPSAGTPMASPRCPKAMPRSLAVVPEITRRRVDHGAARPRFYDRHTEPSPQTGRVGDTGPALAAREIVAGDCRAPINRVIQGYGAITSIVRPSFLPLGMCFWSHSPPHSDWICTHQVVSGWLLAT